MRQNGGRESVPGAEWARAAERMVTLGIVMEVSLSHGVPAAKSVVEASANRAAFIHTMLSHARSGVPFT